MYRFLTLGVGRQSVRIRVEAPDFGEEVAFDESP